METTPYIQKTFNIDEWNHYKDKEFFTALPTLLISKDKTYTITKYERNHKNDCLWRTAKALEALFLTVITLGLALLIKQVFNLYLQAYYAKEIVAVIEPLTPAQKEADKIFNDKQNELQADAPKNIDQLPQEPFNFLALTKDIQGHVLSFIPVLEARKMLQVSKTSQKSLTEYFQSFDVTLATFYELGNKQNYLKVKANPIKGHPQKISDTVIKFREYASQILKYPHIKEYLDKDLQRKNMLLDYFIAKFEDWHSLDEESMINLFTIFFETATKEQLKQFILQRVCATIPKLKYDLAMRDICKLCAKTLNDQRIKQLLDSNDEEVWVALVHLLSYWRPSHQRYLIIKDLQQKMPKNQIWDAISLPNGHINLLESEVIAMKVMSILDDRIGYKEKHGMIRELWSGLRRPGNTSRAMMAIILKNYKLNDEQVKLLALLDQHDDFLESALEMQNFEQHKSLLNGCFEKNIIKRTSSLWSIIFSLKTKEQSEALIQTCQSLDEPFRSIFLRVLADPIKTFNNEKAPEELIHNAFTACGLDLAEFIPLDYKIMRKWLESLKTFDLEKFNEYGLKNFLSEKWLVVGEGGEDSVQEISLEMQLRALVAGIQITDQVFIKTKISIEDTKEIFNASGYVFDHFNNPITLEDLTKDIDWP